MGFWTGTRRWWILSVMALLFLLSQFYRASLAVITPQLLDDLELDARELSLMSAAFFYAFALAQIPLGVYLDRLGPRKTMTLLNLVAVLGALAFAGSGSPLMLILSRILLGVGMACNLMGAFKLLTQWFAPRRFATLAGLVVSIGTAGNVAATTPLVIMAGAFGWRGSFILFSLFNLFLALLCLLVVRDRPAGVKTPPSPTPPAVPEALWSSLSRLFKRKDYWIISFGTFCRYGVYAAVQALWAGPYLMLARRLDPVTAGNMLFLMNMGFILAGPIWGWLSDRTCRTRKGVVITGLCMMALALLGLALLPENAGLVWLAGLFSAFGAFASAGTLMYTHIKELMPLAMSGTAMTGINFFTMIGGAVFLQGLGSLMQGLFPGAALETAAFKAAFSACAACLLLAAALYAFTRENPT